MTTESLIPVLANKLPQFVRENYPNYEKYVRDYLAFLEQDHNFLGIINAWRSNMEPSLNVAPYIDAILTDLGFVSGQNLAIDKPLLIHLLHDFYLSRGTEASFRFLFRMLFNADVAIRYPREQMLVPSYAEYGERHFIYTSANNLDTLDFSKIVLTLRSEGGTLHGVTSKVNASIENIQLFHGAGTPYFQIEVLKPSLEFIVGEPVNIIVAPTTISEFVKPVLSVSVTNSGSGYMPGDVIQVTGAQLNGNAFIDSTKKGGVTGLTISAGGSGNVVGDLITAHANNDTGFGFSAQVSAVSGGAIIGYKIINAGYNYETLPALQTKGVATLLATSTIIGAVNTIAMPNPFVDFDPGTVSIAISSTTGSGAVLAATAVSRFVTRDWVDRKGFLAENSTLIDSDTIQQFAYTIVSSVSAKQYDSFVRDYLHPAGYVRGSSFEIISNLVLNITAGGASIGSEAPILFPATLVTTFVASSSVVETDSIATSTGVEIVTDTGEFIITAP